VKHTLLLAVLLCACARPASAGTPEQERFMRALDFMMIAMGPESARDSKLIKDGYREHLDLLVLQKYDELAQALDNGGLAPLPDEPLRFNFSPRLSGAAPIGEKDLDNQASYIAARPATLGALMTLASRVKSGPIEVTSLVRHTEYQDALRESNGNANTSVPMHTTGLAFDVALLNTPLSRAYEIRDALRAMRDAGEILFIGERQQLVFHVVPHPSRLGYFTDVYTRAVTAAWAASGVPVAIPPVPPLPLPAPPTVAPVVSAEIAAILPLESFAKEWWAAAAGHADLTVDVTPDGRPARRPSNTRTPFGARVQSLLLFFAGTAGVFAFRVRTS
jgi:hypothetical protein